MPDVGWPSPLLQRDAGEYIRFLLELLQAPAFMGQWQARLTEPLTVVALNAPVPEAPFQPDLSITHAAFPP